MIAFTLLRYFSREVAFQRFLRKSSCGPLRRRVFSNIFTYAFVFSEICIHCVFSRASVVEANNLLAYRLKSTPMWPVSSPAHVRKVRTRPQLAQNPQLFLVGFLSSRQMQQRRSRAHLLGSPLPNSSTSGGHKAEHGGAGRFSKHSISLKLISPCALVLNLKQ